MRLLVALALSASGILAGKVAGEDARHPFVADQVIGIVVGLAWGLGPLTVIDCRIWLPRSGLDAS